MLTKTTIAIISANNSNKPRPLSTNLKKIQIYQTKYTADLVSGQNSTSMY